MQALICRISESRNTLEDGRLSHLEKDQFAVLLVGAPTQYYGARSVSPLILPVLFKRTKSRRERQLDHPLASASVFSYVEGRLQRPPH